MGVLSTITSPAFSELVIIIHNKAKTLPSNVTLFETLRAMSGVRPFKLVFLLDPQDAFQEEERRELVGALDLVVARDFLDFLDSPPTIRSA